MIGFLRCAVFGLGALAVLFWLVRIYARSLRREALEKHWARESAAGVDLGPCDAYVEAGMQDYEHGLMRRLVWLVFILPIVIFAVVVFVMNYR
ncbi:hypothetical protein EOW65_04880 [Sinirhodobacter ferrireducens]|uniref:Uncharacterized protein n=1 Tax=Paenirhodobacter ferrireducens TaxID=1215032 RepID=A0A443LP03_9RHOB|nr:hypothetical protein [Sinirhodobacter ferrireducens]RWR50896.1 hypothetical protein EOW65_04880 [Sinirhodobacter ferrireducens]